MNLAISRVEVIALTGVKRTKTFELQKKGDLKVQSTFSAKDWFDLEAVLGFVAAKQGYPAPQKSDVEKHAQLILSERLKNQQKRS